MRPILGLFGVFFAAELCDIARVAPCNGAADKLDPPKPAACTVEAPMRSPCDGIPARTYARTIVRMAETILPRFSSRIAQ